MVACVEKLLKRQEAARADGLKVAVFGATGVVGFASGVIAALEGANVTLVGYDGSARVERAAAEIKRRFGVTVRGRRRQRPMTQEGAHPARCRGQSCAPAAPACRSCRGACWRSAEPACGRADVNAVPPAGVEGLDATGERRRRCRLEGALGIGALAIGGMKYQTEFGLFRQMIAADEAGQPRFSRRFQRWRGELGRMTCRACWSRRSPAARSPPPRAAMVLRRWWPICSAISIRSRLLRTE